jgi:hypothetical protein
VQSFTCAEIINRIPVIRYFTRYFTRIFTSKKLRNTRKKKMKIFGILKIDGEYSVMHYPSDRLKLDPLAVLPNHSGVATTPLDRVSEASSRSFRLFQ